MNCDRGSMMYKYKVNDIVTRYLFINNKKVDRVFVIVDSMESIFPENPAYYCKDIQSGECYNFWETELKPIELKEAFMMVL